MTVCMEMLGFFLLCTGKQEHIIIIITDPLMADYSYSWSGLLVCLCVSSIKLLYAYKMLIYQYPYNMSVWDANIKDSES